MNTSDIRMIDLPIYIIRHYGTFYTYTFNVEYIYSLKVLVDKIKKWNLENPSKLFLTIMSDTNDLLSTPSVTILQTEPIHILFKLSFSAWVFPDLKFFNSYWNMSKVKLINDIKQAF